jgi:hypothetical protein
MLRHGLQGLRHHRSQPSIKEFAMVVYFVGFSMGLFFLGLGGGFLAGYLFGQGAVFKRYAKTGRIV